MTIKFDERGKKLNENALQLFEKKIGHRLPEDYRQFLKSSNGGILSDELAFNFTEDGKPSDTVLSEFYTLADDAEFGTLNDAIEVFVHENRMPSWFLPIADDVFGNQICISLANDDIGCIYFWNHEDEAESSDNSKFKNISRISTSFSEFVGILAISDE